MKENVNGEPGVDGEGLSLPLDVWVSHAGEIDGLRI